MQQPLTRLSEDNYVKPAKTKSESYSLDKLEEILENYSETAITAIPVGTLVKYFSKVDGKDKYRPGGRLINKSGLPKYVVLSNGKRSWSVQVEGTKFFRRMTDDEIKDEYEDIISEKNDIIKKLKDRLGKYENVDDVKID